MRIRGRLHDFERRSLHGDHVQMASTLEAFLGNGDEQEIFNPWAEVMDGAIEPPLSECILFFGAYVNGNLGDVIQSLAMEELFASIAPDMCFWYAYPSGEKKSHGYRIGEFFGKNASHALPLDATNAREVNRFKAIVIGGGGIFVATHAPLENSDFAQALTIPIIIFGVGASSRAKANNALIERAIFVSGRDETSVSHLAKVLQISERPVISSDDVKLVRDPVLSDKKLSDIEGKCWKRSGGERQPMCFVLPASNSESLAEFHRRLVSNIVREGDVFVNVFPKHQNEIVAHKYPGEVEQVLDPEVYMDRLCSCRAIISTRLHGTILGFHMGVPSLGAWHHDDTHKVHDLTVDVMNLPDQFVLVTQNLTREDLQAQVDSVVHAYHDGARRDHINNLMETFYEDTQVEIGHVLDEILKFETLPRSGGNPVEPVLGLVPGAKFIPSAAAHALRSCVVFAVLVGFIVAMAMRHKRSMGKSALSDVVPDESSRRETREKKKPSPADGSSVVHFTTYEGGDIPRVSMVKLAMDFVVWVLLAIGFSAYGKVYLNKTQDPAGLLALQGAMGVIMLGGLGYYGALDLDPYKEVQLALRTPTGRVAVLHTCQAFLTNMAVLIGGVSVTNALKAMEPVAAAVFSYFLLGKRSSRAKIMAILTIVGGIIILTSKGRGSGGAGHGGGSAVLISSLITGAAVCFNALRNVVLKRDAPTPPYVTLFICSVVATVVGMSVMLATLFVEMLGPKEEGTPPPLSTGWLRESGINAALCFVGYNFASFNLLTHLSPVGHAVGNSCKRMMVFASGLVMLGEAMSSRQLLGAITALGGVLGYNIAGLQQR